MGSHSILTEVVHPLSNYHLSLEPKEESTLSVSSYLQVITILCLPLKHSQTIVIPEPSEDL